MAHVSMSRGTHIGDSWHIYQRRNARLLDMGSGIGAIASALYLSHGTHINESWRTYQCVLAYT